MNKKLKYCVLGAGLMGRAIAYDLLQQNDTQEVIIADKDKSKLNEVKEFLKDKQITTKILNAGEINEVEGIFKEVNCAIGAMHYSLNRGFTEVAIKTKTNFCDLGGNNTVVDEQRKMDDRAKESGVSIIPDCGLAPGMVAVLVKWGLENFSWADSVKIRVGGLPQEPKGILKYERLFSVEGLINEYVEPVRVLRNGEIKTIEPLIEIESLEFPRKYSNISFEAFTTSGGVSTLIETYKSRLKNLDYKTIRYPGHANIIRTMYELGLFSDKPLFAEASSITPRKIASTLLEKNIPLCKKDVTLVKIIFEGKNKKHELVIVDEAKLPLTSMMRTTAFPASIIAQMQGRKQIEKLGVQPQECCVPSDLFISELEKRNISVFNSAPDKLELSSIHLSR